MLTPAQASALDHVRLRARGDTSHALERIASLTATPYPSLAAGIVGTARVTLNFHPDRIVAGDRTIAAALRDGGIYRSQFESRVSNGSRTAFPGGERDRWEELLFGGAYQTAGVVDADRPKYGCLNVVNHIDGGSPRFGSCHVRLGHAALDRSTFCFGDSHVGPTDVGTIDAFHAVLAELLEDATAGAALARSGVDLSTLLAALTDDGAPLAPGGGRALDDYIEAQVHGVVDLAHDAEALVIDPSFRDTEVGIDLVTIAQACGLEVAWLPGFELDFDAVPEEFRGPAIPVLAARIRDRFASAGERLDAEVLGRAAQSLARVPDEWADWGTFEEALQHIKQLWHVLVRFGEPA